MSEQELTSLLAILLLSLQAYAWGYGLGYSHGTRKKERAP